MPGNRVLVMLDEFSCDCVNDRMNLKSATIIYPPICAAFTHSGVMRVNVGGGEIWYKCTKSDARFALCLENVALDCHLIEIAWFDLSVFKISTLQKTKVIGQLPGRFSIKKHKINRLSPPTSRTYSHFAFLSSGKGLFCFKRKLKLRKKFCNIKCKIFLHLQVQGH